ncbi:MAG: hypothetical protein VW338_17520, partial [Rhodospirillaceae bacterium]
MTTFPATTGGAQVASPPAVSDLSYIAFESNADGTIEVIGSADDGDHADGGSSNPSGTAGMVAGWALDDTPSDFGTMDDLTAQVRYALDATDADIDCADLRCRIVNGTTLLAGGSNVAVTNAASFQTVVSGSFSNTSFANSSSTSFGYVNTSAAKTAWDGATLEIAYTRTRSKGGGTNVVQVSAAEVTGNYTTGASETPQSVNASATSATSVERTTSKGVD